MRHAQSVYDGDWDAAINQGRTMTLEQAIELVKTETGSGLEPQTAITTTNS
jgi:hypothetical protein